MCKLLVANQADVTATPLKHAIVTFVKGDDGCPEMSTVAAYLRSIRAPK